MASPIAASLEPAASRPIQWLYYPAVMAGAIATAWALHHAGAPLALSAYLAVAASALAVFVGERLIPYRRDWSPTKPELLDDGLYMLAVQVLLPLGLTWLAVNVIQAALSAAGLTLRLWPVAWPVWAQVVLKIAAGDFLRYWLHRWSHEHGVLWRLHAVHHAPRKLYALNVFRFHPLDKALQFLGDTLPFILLGVGPETLAYYFVVYATGGFFQHSNLDVRYGWLNYLVVGPELHRWHHSRKVAESNANYAHTFVLWDLLFGTYRRPRDRRVEALGLLDDGYPDGFLRQLAAPARRTTP
jgi:sterol desaturase/sphingolipid hydroxylase (fatty acid hydroxylase superfamily)